MAKKSKKAKRGAPARTKNRMKRAKKKPVPKPASAPVAPSVWEGFGGKTKDH